MEGAVQDWFLLQNWSSSAEYGQSNTEASTSGHCLGSKGKSGGEVKIKREKGKLDLEIFCPKSEVENQRRGEQVRRGVTSPVH